MFTAILARRLEIILPEIIHLDQTGFIKHRQAQDSIRRTLHVMQHVIKNQIVGSGGNRCGKVFYSVGWDFRIRINGSLSKFITLEQGCRQGCPASPLLFAIFLEPLGNWIKQNENITGIDIGRGIQKIALFADDVVIYLSSPNMSFPALMTTLTPYWHLLGYKINIQKTQVITFNYRPYQAIRDNYKIDWDSKSIIYLAVNLPQDLGQLKSINYDLLLNKIKTDISRWNLIPYMGITQRMEVIKIDVLPTLLYLFQSLPVEVTEDEFREWD